MTIPTRKATATVNALLLNELGDAVKARNAMYVRHPFGLEFAKWVEVTDSYRLQLDRASPERAPIALAWFGWQSCSPAGSTDHWRYGPRIAFTRDPPRNVIASWKVAPRPAF